MMDTSVGSGQTTATESPAPTAPPAPRNVCLEENHPSYMDVLFRLNHLDYSYRAAEQYYLTQLMTSDHTIRSAEALINQLLTENNLWQSIIRLRDQEISELKQTAASVSGTPNSSRTATASNKQ